MARATVEAWLPEEKDGTVLRRISQLSAIESVARRLPMSGPTKAFPRSGGASVAVVPKGSAYGEDVTAVDDIILDGAEVRHRLPHRRGGHRRLLRQHPRREEAGLGRRLRRVHRQRAASAPRLPSAPASRSPRSTGP